MEDSIFESFMAEPEPEKEEEKECECKNKLVLNIENLVLRGAHIYSLMKLPHLSLYMIKGEGKLIQESKIKMKQI